MQPTSSGPGTLFRHREQDKGPLLRPPTSLQPRPNPGGECERKRPPTEAAVSVTTLNLNLIGPKVIPILRASGASQVIDHSAGRRQTMRARLTPRQREIADLMAKALTFREIARDLGLVEGYVKRRMSDAYRRIGVKNGRELVELLKVAN